MPYDFEASHHHWTQRNRIEDWLRGRSVLPGRGAPAQPFSMQFAARRFVEWHEWRVQHYHPGERLDVEPLIVQLDDVYGDRKMTDPQARRLRLAPLRITDDEPVEGKEEHEQQLAFCLNSLSRRTRLRAVYNGGEHPLCHRATIRFDVTDGVWRIKALGMEIKFGARDGRLAHDLNAHWTREEGLDAIGYVFDRCSFEAELARELVRPPPRPTVELRVIEGGQRA